MAHGESIDPVGSHLYVSAVYNDGREDETVDDDRAPRVTSMHGAEDIKGTFVNTQSEYLVWIVRNLDGTNHLQYKVLHKGERGNGDSAIIDINKNGTIDADDLVYTIPEGTTFEIRIWSNHAVANSKKFVAIEPSSWQDRAAMLSARKVKGFDRYGTMSVEQLVRIMGDKSLCSS